MIDPAVPYFPRVFRVGSDQVLAIIVPGSELRPHFVERPVVRVGAESKKVTNTQFEELLAQRNSMPAWILRWKNLSITITVPIYIPISTDTAARETEAWVVDCNQFFVTVRVASSSKYSFPLRRVEICHDHEH